MRSLADAAIAGGARNPATAVALLDNISNSLSKDQNLDWSDVKGLINAFRDLDPSSIEMLTLPIVGAMRGDAEVVVPKEPDAEPMLNRLRTFSGAAAALPVAVSPDEVTVRVVNGSSHPEWGDEVLDGLVAHGFHGVGKAETGDRTRLSAHPDPLDGGRSRQGDHRRVVPRHRQRGAGPTGRDRRRRPADHRGQRLG